MVEGQSEQVAILEHKHRVDHPRARALIAGAAIFGAYLMSDVKEVSATDPICGEGKHLAPIDENGDGVTDYTRCVADAVADPEPEPANPGNPSMPTPNNPKPAPTTTEAPVIDGDADNFPAPEGRIPAGTIIVDISDSSPGEGQVGIDKAKELGIDVDIPEGATPEETERILLNIAIAQSVNSEDWQTIRDNYAVYGIGVMVETTLPPETVPPTTRVPATTQVSTSTTVASATVPSETTPPTSEARVVLIVPGSETSPTTVAGESLPQDDEDSSNLSNYILLAGAAGIGVEVFLLVRRRRNTNTSNPDEHGRYHGHGHKPGPGVISGRSTFKHK